MSTHSENIKTIKPSNVVKATMQVEINKFNSVELCSRQLKAVKLMPHTSNGQAVEPL
jgi:hypothetical protein